MIGCGVDDESIGADVDAGIAVTGTFDVTDGIGSCKGGGAESIAVGGVGALTLFRLRRGGATGSKEGPGVSFVSPVEEPKGGTSV